MDPRTTRPRCWRASTIGAFGYPARPEPRHQPHSQHRDRDSRGEWIAFLDDDNEWAPEYLERQLALAASRPGAGVAYCRARRRPRAARDRRWRSGELRQGRVFCDLVEGLQPVRLERADPPGGPCSRPVGSTSWLRSTEDRDLWMRLAQRTEFAGASDALLIRHERHGPQLSRNPDFLARDAVTSPRSGETPSRRPAGAVPTGAGSCGWCCGRSGAAWSARRSAAAGNASRRRARPDGCSGSFLDRRRTWPRRWAGRSSGRDGWNG